MKYRRSFYTHGCTKEIVDYVINYGLWYQLHDSPRGNEQVMYVGWDCLGNKIWEIGIELYPDGEEDWAFHAQQATVYSRSKVR